MSTELATPPTVPSRLPPQAATGARPKAPPMAARAHDGAMGEDARARWLLGAMARVLQATQAQHAARALVMHLASTLRCQRVALGWRKRPDLPLSLQALSDLTRPADAPELVQDLEATMQEAASAACTLSYPARRREDVMPGLAHVQLGRALGASAVCSVPLGRRGEVFGVLTLQRELGQPFTASEVLRLEEAATFLAPMLERQYALSDSARAQVSGPHALWLRHRRHLPWLAVAVAAALSAWPVQHDVVAPAQVQGLNERQLSAPRDGYIAAVLARPGDTVKADAPLLRLDSELAKQDVRAAQAALEQAESTVSEALAKHDQGQLVTHLAKVDESRARLAQAQSDLSRSVVPSPTDGVVVSGDWTRAIGAPVKRGDVLFTLAPDGALRLNLWVDERDIDDVRVGNAGQLRLAASPDRAWPVVVQRLTPVARLREGRNGFDVEATLTTGTGHTDPAAAQWLRPGLEGIARLEADRRAWIRSQGQRAWRWLRLQWWTWLG